MVRYTIFQRLRLIFLRNADSTGGSEVNISGMNTSVLKIFDIEKNKVVYEADFDSLDIESPVFIKGNK